MINLLSRRPEALKKLKLVSKHSIFSGSGSQEKAPCNSAVATSETKTAVDITQTPSNPQLNSTVVKTLESKKAAQDGYRINPVGIQMLPSNLYKQLFGGSNVSFSEKDVQNALATLNYFGLKTETAGTRPEVDLVLPPLKGYNIEEHFLEIGKEQSEPYRKLLETLTGPLPHKPCTWELQPGWTRYVPGQPPERVSFPQENAILIDVEVCMSAGQMPTLAIAASAEAWYGWVSPGLVEGSITILKRSTTQHLIPLESDTSQRGVGLGENLKCPRIAVGHNVMYDRARIKEQYWLERTGMRFMDTMSMHISVGGVTSYQKMLIMKARKAAASEEENDSHLVNGELDDESSLLLNSSLNSLGEVLQLYRGRTLDKSTRDYFVDGQLTDIVQNFQTCMSYCASDVTATHEVFQELFPLFLERFPHPVTLAGMLEISMAYLPVNSNWDRYIEGAQQTYQDLSVESRFELSRRADDACKLLHNEAYKKDIWMWDQDWSVSDLRLLKRKAKKNPKKDVQEENNGTEINNPHLILDELKKRDEEFKEEKITDPEIQALMDTGFQLPLRPPHLPGYPAWYRKLCLQPKEPDWAPGPQLITTKMQVTPKLLHLTWEKYPLHFIRGEGWGCLRPAGPDGPSFTDQKEMEDAVRLPVKELVHLWNSIPENERKYGGNVLVCEGVMFSKLPHKNGPDFRVGDPLGRDFLVKFSNNVLSGDSVAMKVLDIAMKMSYWRNNRDRIMGQLVVWLQSREMPQALEGSQIGAILPQLVVCGTLTRRAVERTWMTASNISKNRIGSELRAMIQAPPGYSIVGADVDSQELWIASLIGDADSTKMHGGTPFGWMTLSGQKSEGTDMHSVTAKAVGISRDHAKVINYARIYGAGPPFAEQLLKQFNPTMTTEEAKSKAKKMFEMTKGQKTCVPKKKFFDLLSMASYSREVAEQFAQRFGQNRSAMFDYLWYGGTESAMFNRLEKIAGQYQPKTPFLSGRLSRALEMHKDQHLRTRINWVVQSGAVDFLHLLLVAFRSLEPDARFCLSFHDEVRYLVSDDKAYRAALALHAAHLLTRAFCASKLGLVDLPYSVAFFTSVEVDKTLRKEANHNCQTPSNPHGLQKSYGIPLGESLNIYEALEKAGGPLALLPQATTKHVKKRKDVSSNKTEACDAQCAN